MQCMKCGRDVEAGEVFCVECREVMERYPVKPGTVVQLPYRPPQAPQKKQPPRRRNALPLEEQLKLLKRLTRTLAAALVVLILAVSGLGVLSVKLYLDGKDKVLPGQNYSAISTTAPSTEPSTETTAPATEAPVNAAG